MPRIKNARERTPSVMIGLPTAISRRKVPFPREQGHAGLNVWGISHLPCQKTGEAF